MAKIAILGSGGFGLSIAVMCNNAGHDVTVWSKFQDEIDTIKRTGELKVKLAGVKIPEDIDLTTNLECVKGKDLIIMGIPTAFVRDVCESISPLLDENSIIVNTAKGLEAGTLKTMSQIMDETFPKNKTAILTGPSHAEELARGIPTTIVVASDDRDVSYYVQNTLTNGSLRIYVNDDVMGCELGGSLKNVIALAAGVVDGLGLGDNTKAALMTRGINEISVLGVAMGAKVATFSGLSGIGDLIVTCTSMHSRNRRAGILIGQGVSPEEAVERVGTVEGYSCTKNAHELSRKIGIEMPITEQLYSVLFEGGNASNAISALMDRPSRNETERDFLY